MVKENSSYRVTAAWTELAQLVHCNFLQGVKNSCVIFNGVGYFIAITVNLPFLHDLHGYTASSLNNANA